MSKPGSISTSEHARALARRRHSVDTAINQIVRAWPTLTAEQRSRLASLLKPAAGPDDREAA